MNATETTNNETLILGVSIPQDASMEEMLATQNCAAPFKRLLSVKQNEEEDFYEYTQGIRQAIVARYVEGDSVDNLRLRSNVDADEVEQLLKTLKDIDSATNNRVKAAINKEKVQEFSDVKAIVTETLRSVTHTSFQNGHNNGRIPESQLGTREYVEGERSLIQTDNFGNDYNFFKKRLDANAEA